MGAQVPGSWGGIETALGTLPGEFSLTHTRVEYAGGALPKHAESVRTEQKVRAAGDSSYLELAPSA